MFRKITTILLLAMAVSASALERAPRFEPLRKAVPVERTEATAAPRRLQPAVHAKGIGLSEGLHDASAVARTYTAVPPMRVLGDGTTIYGSIIYADSWLNSGAAYGLYSMKAASAPQISLLHSQGTYEANGGGAYSDADGKYYYYSYVYTEEMGYTFATWIEMNPATGEIAKTTHSFMESSFDQSQITHDLTIDPTTGKIYAISYIKVVIEEGLIERWKPALSTVDSYTGFVTPVAETPGLIAIACNKAGELYGISKGTASTLYRINKETGECTEIGRTGLTPEYVQSATFDPITDKLYWAETELNGISGLYEVDITTGAASPICKFANNEEFTGIYIPEPAVAADAPAAPEALGTTFAPGALTGTIDFTIPTRTYGGAVLSGTVTADIDLDGGSLHTGEYTAGQTVKFPVTLTEGTHNFAVQLSTVAGESPRKALSWHVGIDAPAAVGNLTLTRNASDEAVISWSAPTAGRNGGYIDPAQITYTVRRMPEGATIAEGITTTTVTDRSTFETANVYYNVIAFCGTREGATASTEEALFGKGSLLPVTFSFDTQDDFDLCTVVDANGDADRQYNWGLWLYGPNFSYAGVTDGCAVYAYSPTSAADDWIFMPPFTAESGRKYRVSFDLWTKGDTETLEVTFGSSNAPTGQTVALAKTNYSHKDVKTYTDEFTAKADGNCYVGFHCTSAKKKFYLYIDNVTVDEVPDTGAPAAVADFTVTPGAQGALSATISLKAPVLTTGGDALAAISRIDIFRGNDRTAIHSFAAPAPGAVLNWTDTEPEQGFNTYRVVGVNASGEGEKALATEWIGYDFPTACTDFTLSEAGGHPVLTWTAPTTGLNGGYVAPDELVYRIRRSDGTLMSSHATGTSFTDTSLDAATKQYFIYYQIEPVSAAGVGDYALSNHLVFGDPYTGDFFESFADVSVQNDPWTMYLLKGQSQLWTLQSQGYSPYAPAADGDGGIAVFATTNGRVNDEGRLVSPKISISDMQVPVFSFAFFHNLDEDTAMGGDQFTDRLIPEVCLPDGSYVAVGEPIYVDDPNYESGWYLYTYDLSHLKQYGYVQLSFHGIAGFANDVMIDYVSLESNVNNDLLAYTFSGPSKVKVGKTGKYKLTIFNQGMQTATDFTVRLRRDDTEIASLPGNALASGRYATYEFEVGAAEADEGRTIDYIAYIDFAADDIPANNSTTVVSTFIASPDVPQPGKVWTSPGTHPFGYLFSNLTLNWSDADALHVDDSFEDYTAFSIDGFGDYTLIDGDAGYTYTFNDIYYENSGDRMAFMVFNPDKLYISMLDEWKARTGSQVLAAFSACDETGTAIDSDDWLISPELHEGSSLSFWAKTATWEWGLESFEIYYSSTDKNKASFKKLYSVPSVPTEWQCYDYSLPADAKYFAIRYNSNDKFVLYIDDLFYTTNCTLPGATLTGYRIYRDGVLIGEVGSDVHEFFDEPGTDRYTYGISAVFGNRESKPTQIEVKMGAVSTDEIDAASARVYALDGAIAVDCRASAPVSVSNAAGITLFSGSGSESYRIPAAPGVYIITVASSTHKLIVK